MTYEENCLQLDKELAELLGWKIVTERLISFPNVGIVYKHCFISGINPNYPYGDNFELPRWTQDDSAAFQLMVEYQCFPKYEDSWHKIMVNGSYFEIVSEDIKQSIRCVIVQAVIHKLKACSQS